MVELPLLLGIIGMLFVLLGFIMIQTHRWSADDMAFDLANLIGSGLLVVYGLAGHAWPFVILNGVFALYSLKEVVSDLMAKKPSRRKR
jgi:hypothetical protein